MPQTLQHFPLLQIKVEALKNICSRRVPCQVQHRTELCSKDLLYYHTFGQLSRPHTEMCRIQGVHGACWNLWLKTAERNMAPLRLRSHSHLSPISTSDSERTQLVRTPDLTDLCSNSSGSQSFLSPYLASDDNVSSLSPHVMLITHI